MADWGHLDEKLVRHLFEGLTRFDGFTRVQNLPEAGELPNSSSDTRALDLAAGPLADEKSFDEAFQMLVDRMKEAGRTPAEFSKVHGDAHMQYALRRHEIFQNTQAE